LDYCFRVSLYAGSVPCLFATIHYGSTASSRRLQKETPVFFEKIEKKGNCAGDISTSRRIKTIRTASHQVGMVFAHVLSLWFTKQLHIVDVADKSEPRFNQFSCFIHCFGNR
jgi:hypothetical protein